MPRTDFGGSRIRVVPALVVCTSCQDDTVPEKLTHEAPLRLTHTSNVSAISNCMLACQPLQLLSLAITFPYNYADDEVFIDVIGKSPSIQIQAIKVGKRTKDMNLSGRCVRVAVWGMRSQATTERRAPKSRSSIA